MRARTFLYQFMIASPVIMLAAVGVQTRTYHDDFEFARYSPHLEKKIRAYSGVMRAVELANDAEGTDSHPRLVRAAAAQWVQDSRSGELQPLEPEFLTDAINDGVKSQIYSACMGLCADLMVNARELSRQGEYDAAANDLVLATEVVQTLKYSDLTSVGAISTRQRGIFRMIGEYAPHLSAEVQKSLTERLARLEHSEKPVEPILERARGLFVKAKKQDADRIQSDSFAKLVQEAGPTDPNAIRVLAEPPVDRREVPRNWNSNWSEGHYVVMTVDLQRQVNRELIQRLQNQLANKR
ncbi:MAG: hypothetical protein KF784_01105 [Fimbriimonadaceae bacterium]|nr:hypothetical protein [Fimbriimonadaceae bacterium]